MLYINVELGRRQVVTSKLDDVVVHEAGQLELGYRYRNDLKEPLHRGLGLIAVSDGKHEQGPAGCSLIRGTDQHPSTAGVEPLNVIDEYDDGTGRSKELAEKLRQPLREGLLHVLRRRQRRGIPQDALHIRRQEL